MQRERNSSIEILRILAMLGIVIMHTNGTVMEHSVGWKLGYCFNGESLLQIVKAFIPVSTNRYWFITCYILLMLFAPYLNSAIDLMNQKQFTQLLMSMILVFVVAPTVLYYSVLGERML